MVRKARAHLHAGDDDHPHDHDHHDHHDHDEHDHHHHHHHAEGEAHHEHAHHVVTPDQIGGGWREQLGVVLAVGTRPCSGALVVLVFALSQGLLAAGIAAVFLMGLGTAITVGILATIAVSAKGLAQRLLGTHSEIGSSVLWWLELFGAILVLAFGALLVVATL
jgi:ABC-type nickel/cobalt efflux system permease component RcnA